MDETPKPGSSSIEVTLEEHLKWMPERVVYMTKHGSKAYGTADADSQEEWRAIVVAPLESSFGFRRRFELLEVREHGIAFVDVRKYFQMAAAAAPNALELLWTDPAHRSVVHQLGNVLLSRRKDFLSKRILRSFVGYAEAEAKKMFAGAKPPEEGERPSKRRELIERHGYDTRALMNAVRLLRMAKEILDAGDVLVARPDAQELLQIQGGSMTRDQGVQFVQSLAKAAVAAAERSSLPDHPNEEKLDLLCMGLCVGACNFHVEMPIMLPGFKSEQFSFATGSLSDKKLGAEASS